jgi:flavin reductase (DIM6/NTAB) family NADH-FMN oxidoreductase RutF
VSDAPRPDLDPFVGSVDYPMYVATTAAGDKRGGCLIGFATQTSIQPPRFLACLSRVNATTRVATDASHLALHLIGPEQRHLAELFGEQSGDWTDKFEQVAWRSGPGGVPVLAGCPAVLVGRVLDRLDLGDHVGYLLEPVEVVGRANGDELTFQQLREMKPGHPA